MAHEGKRHGFAASGNSKIYTTDVSKVVKNNYANLLAQEKANSTWSRQNSALDPNVSKPSLVFPSLTSMQVTAEDVSDYVQTLDTEKASVGVNDQYYNGDVPNMSILSDEVAEIDTSKLAATSQFMSNYNDNQLYELSPGNNIKVVDLNQNLNDEILNTSHADLEKASGVAFENAKKEGAANAAALMQEMAEDTKKAEILESQAIEAQVDHMISAAEIQTAEKQQALDDARQTFHFKDLNKDGEVTIDEEEQHYLNQNNGLDYSEQLAAEIVAEGGNVTGSFFETKTENIVGTDTDSLIEKEILANGKFTLSDGSVVDAGGHDAVWHETLLQEKITAEKNAAEIMKEIEDEERKKRIQLRTQERFKDTLNPEIPAESYFESAGTAKAKAEAKKKAEVERMTAVLDAQDEGKRLGKEGDELARKKQEEKERMAAVLDRTETERRGKGLDTSGDAEGQRFANLPTDTSTLGKDVDIRSRQPKGTIYPGDPDNKVRGDQLPRLEKERLAAQKKADEHSKTQGLRHIGVGKETPFMTHTRKQDSLAVQLAKHNMPMFMSDAEKQKMVSALDRIDEEREGGDDEASLIKWNKDPFRFSTFAYPRDVTTSMENGHYILFYVNVQNKTKYSYEGISETASIIPVGDQIMTEEWKQEGTGKYEWKERADGTSYRQMINKDVLKQSWKSGASKVFDTNIDYQRRMVLAGHKGNILRSNQVNLKKGRKSYQGLDSVHKSTTRITDSVALYLPPAVSDNTSVAYENQSLGMAGFLAFSFGEVVNKWKARDFEGVADTIFEMGGTALVESMRTMGLGAFGLITGADEGAAKATFDKAFGQAVNPYIEVTFNSMGMRDFSYTFNFSPKSKQETQDVQDIIQLFRFHMAPELKGTNHRFLTLPSTFDIHYMYQTSPEKAKENTFYNKIATCVLTGCNVDYTPNGVRSFEDGAPTQISMTLNFQETKMLTKQKINEGF